MDPIYNIKGMPSDILEGDKHSGRSISVANNYTKDISTGDINGSKRFGGYGKITTAGAVVDQLLWANGAWSIPAPEGEQIRIVSDSMSDGVDGIGIRSVYLHYLDSNLVEQTEVVVLNGTTESLTIATDIRFIQCAHMETYGTSKKSVGTISLTNLAGTKTYNELDAGFTRCSSSARMVPSGKRAVVVSMVASSVSGTADTSSLISVGVSYFEGHDYTADAVLIPIGTVGMQDSSVVIDLKIPHIAPSGTIVGMLCSCDKSAIISGNWYGWLEDDI